MGNTTISWTNKAWNPLVGCRKVSPGCARCYAERMANRQAAMARAKIAKGQDPGRSANYMQVVDDKGRWNGKIVTVPDALADPFSWRTPCMVFVNSMSDLFHEDVPFEFIDQVFAVMAFTSRHTYQVLTKRPDRAAEYLNDIDLDDRIDDICHELPGALDETWHYPAKWPLPNVHLGTSPCNQKTLDEAVPHLLRCPAAVRWLSIEPLLGPITLDLTGIDWVVVGCESVGQSVGRLSTPNPIASRATSESEWLQWAADIVGQCQAAKVPVHVKQIPVNGYVEKDVANFPEALRFQEYPRAGTRIVR